MPARPFATGQTLPNGKHADRPSSDDAHDATVLDLLLNEHPGLWTIDELKRIVGDDTTTDGALARLSALGLTHITDGCVFATRAAAHMHKLHEAA